MPARTDQIAAEMSYLMPTFLMNMFPFVFEPMKMPPRQVLACICIEERNGCTLGDLARDLHVSAPTVTGIIDRLQRDGFVKRSPGETDRRVVNVTLTQKGRAIPQKLRENIQKRWTHILNRLPEDMREAPLSMVRQITQRFKDGSI